MSNGLVGLVPWESFPCFPGGYNSNSISQLPRELLFSCSYCEIARQYVGHDDDNNNIADDDTQQLQYMNIKNHVICLFILQLSRAASAARWQANQSNIDLIFMDVMCNELGARLEHTTQGLNHHANPGALLKHTKPARDSHFITIRYVGTREPKKEETRLPDTFSRPEKKGHCNPNCFGVISTYRSIVEHTA
jgi:hypothetical protein